MQRFLFIEQPKIRHSNVLSGCPAQDIDIKFRCWLLYLTRKCVFWEIDFILQIFYPYDQDNIIAKIILFAIWATGKKLFILCYL